MTLPILLTDPPLTQVINTASDPFTASFASITATGDGTLEVGDVMIALFEVGRQNTEMPWFADPAFDNNGNEWDKEQEFTESSADCIIAAYIRLADADDVAGTNHEVTILPNSATLRKVVGIVAYRGVNPANIINASNSGGTTSIATAVFDINGITTNKDNCAILAAYGQDGANVYSSSTSGWTRTYVEATFNSRMGIFTKDTGQAAQGVVPDLEITQSSAGKVSWLILAIEPGASVPTLTLPTASEVSGSPTSWAGTITTNAAGPIFSLFSANSTELAATVKAGKEQAVDAPGTINVTGSGTPGATGYVHYIQEGSGGDSTVISTATASVTLDAAFTNSGTYDGSTIPDDSLLYVTDGTHTDVASATVLTDGTQSWAVDGLIGMFVNNTADGSTGTITDNTATTVTVSALSGGTLNQFSTNDTYNITLGAVNTDVVYGEETVVITAGVGAYKAYIFNGEYSETFTTALASEASGTFDVTIGTDGTISLDANPIVPAAVVYGLTVQEDGTTTGSGAVNTDTLTSGTLRYVASTSESPNPANGASQAITASNPQSFTFTGLTPNTFYYVAVDQVTSGGDSNVLYSSFMTEVDTGPDLISVSTSGGSQFVDPILSWSSDRVGTYYVTAGASVSVPSVAEIQAGQSAGGQAADFAETANMASGANQSTLTGLTVGGANYAFLQAKDNTGTDNAVLGPYAITWAVVSADAAGDVPGSTQQLIQTTGGNLDFQLTNDTLLTAGTGPVGDIAFCDEFVASVTSDQSLSTGWNTQIRDALSGSDLVRVNSGLLRLPIPANSDYLITSDESIAAYIPNELLTIATSDISVDPFSITTGTAVEVPAPYTAIQTTVTRVVRARSGPTRQGEIFPFAIEMDAGFTVTAEVKQFAGDQPALRPAIAYTNGMYYGNLTASDTAALAVGQWFIYLTATRTGETLIEPIKCYIAKGV